MHLLVYHLSQQKKIHQHCNLNTVVPCECSNAIGKIVFLEKRLFKEKAFLILIDIFIQICTSLAFRRYLCTLNSITLYITLLCTEGAVRCREYEYTIRYQEE